jgi:hypothetical protein
LITIKRYTSASGFDDVNILGGSIHAVKEKAETLVVAIKETALEVMPMYLSTWSCVEIRMQNGQCDD